MSILWPSSLKVSRADSESITQASSFKQVRFKVHQKFLVTIQKHLKRLQIGVCGAKPNTSVTRKAAIVTLTFPQQTNQGSDNTNLYKGTEGLLHDFSEKNQRNFQISGRKTDPRNRTITASLNCACAFRTRVLVIGLEKSTTEGCEPH